MSGFEVVPEGERRPSTAGEKLDFALQLHEQSLDILETMATEDRARIARLEATVAMLEALITGPVTT